MSAQQNTFNFDRHAGGRPRLPIPPEMEGRIVYVLRKGTKRHSRYVKNNCGVCSKEFLAQYHDFIKGRGRYCSVECRHWGRADHGPNAQYCACGCGNPLTTCKSRPRRAKRFLFKHSANLKRLSELERHDRKIKARERAARWYVNNLERAKEWSREYRRRMTPAQRSVYTEQRRTRVREASGTHSSEQWLARIKFFGWSCRYCALPLSLKTLTKDHMIPLIRGGSSWASNLVPSCLKCNCRKGRRTFFEFLRHLQKQENRAA